MVNISSDTGGICWTRSSERAFGAAERNCRWTNRDGRGRDFGPDGAKNTAGQTRRPSFVVSWLDAHQSSSAISSALRLGDASESTWIASRSQVMDDDILPNTIDFDVLAYPDTFALLNFDRKIGWL